MIQIIKEMLVVLKDAFQVYSGNNLIWILYALSLPVIFFLGKKEDRKLFIGTLLAECLTIFNPLFMKILLEKFGFENRFLRFFWMIVFYVTIAYAIVLIVFSLKKRWMRYIIGIMFVVVIIFIGNPVFYGEDTPTYNKTENDYLVSNYILTMSNILHGEGIENPKVLYDADLIFEYRQYDPTVTSFISRSVYDKAHKVSYKKFKKWEGCNNRTKKICRVYFYEDYSLDPETFYECVKKEQIHYIVSNKAELDDYLSKTQAVLYSETAVSRIWKVVY